MTKTAQTNLPLDPENAALEPPHFTVAECERGNEMTVEPLPNTAESLIDYAQFIGQHPIRVTSRDFVSELRDETVEAVNTE